MLTAFTFNGKHSSDFGIIVTSRNIPMISEARTDTEKIPQKDGSYDFSDGTYGDKTIEIECEFMSEEVNQFRSKARQIASWLITRNKARLIFDDESDIYYNVRIINQIDVEQIASIGIFMIQFKSDPFAYSNVQQTKQEILNTSSPATVEIETKSTVNTPPLTIIKHNGNTAINGFSMKVITPKED